MYTGNAAYLVYCDGASFSGNNNTATVFNSTNVHFRGALVRQAMFDDLLNNRGLSNASEVVISGSSAGGLAVFLHVDWWAKMLKKRIPHHVRVVGLPDW
jgi:hypothetical protein